MSFLPFYIDVRFPEMSATRDSRLHNTRYNDHCPRVTYTYILIIRQRAYIEYIHLFEGRQTRIVVPAVHEISKPPGRAEADDREKVTSASAVQQTHGESTLWRVQYPPSPLLLSHSLARPRFVLCFSLRPYKLYYMSRGA